MAIACIFSIVFSNIVIASELNSDVITISDSKENILTNEIEQELINNLISLGVTDKLVHNSLIEKITKRRIMGLYE